MNFCEKTAILSRMWNLEGTVVVVSLSNHDPSTGSG
jgi:hypothetical protein